jgi:catechol 2,3-dioxygenase-like lactoylglutathione lyase family enzyme
MSIKSDPPAERAGKPKLVLPEERWKMPAMQHLAFRADRKNFAKAQQALNEKGIEFRFVDHEISHSIYFKDPDGHEIEITTYDL